MKNSYLGQLRRTRDYIYFPYKDRRSSGHLPIGTLLLCVSSVLPPRFEVSCLADNGDVHLIDLHILNIRSVVLSSTDVCIKENICGTIK